MPAVMVSERLRVESEKGAISVVPKTSESEEHIPDQGKSSFSETLSPMLLLNSMHQAKHQMLWAPLLNVPWKVDLMVSSDLEAHPKTHQCLHLVIKKSCSIWISLCVCVGS